MANESMTFDENYGTLPKNILGLVRKHNVSPADFDLMTDILGNYTWATIAEHIVDNLNASGSYSPRYF